MVSSANAKIELETLLGSNKIVIITKNNHIRSDSISSISRKSSKSDNQNPPPSYSSMRRMKSSSARPDSSVTSAAWGTGKLMAIRNSKIRLVSGIKNQPDVEIMSLLELYGIDEAILRVVKLDEMANSKEFAAFLERRYSEGKKLKVLL